MGKSDEQGPGSILGLGRPEAPPRRGAMDIPLTLYQRYSQPEILVAFGSNTSPRTGWTKLGGHLLGFFEIGRLPPALHFCNTRQFHWYGPGVTGVPEALRKFSALGGGHLFIRAGEDAYVYIADIQHVGMYGGSDGKGRCEATMDIHPPIPTSVLSEVGGLYAHPLGDLAMDQAIASLRNASTPDQSLRAFQSFVEFWRGPIEPSQALESVDLAKASVAIPPLLRQIYLWAGGCEDLMTAGYFSLVPPRELKVYDDRFVAICTECQWCGNYFVKRDALDSADPEVFADDCGDGRSGEGYTDLGISLSQFLWVYYVAFNLTKGPVNGAIDLTAPELERLVTTYPPLPVLGPTAERAVRAIFPCGGVSISDGETVALFAHGGVMGHVVPGSQGPCVSFAAKSDLACETFLSRLGVEPRRVQELV